MAASSKSGPAKITLSRSQDIPFNKLVLSQANVRRVKAGVSIEGLAESIARHSVRPNAEALDYWWRRRFYTKRMRWG